ncbi:3-methyladenine DNA glycosylase [Williamsia sp. 1138]|uniref:DNA-3-methyladenine glycosylase family protein n=1 Tax=Williamsia sp. 1138 TaxID=1903117 RepID=UPI000A10C664|nr:3-methyladenine DNA glycosylase [Williamsia sp. 1138]OZG30193.1 3-methyladenine DNA glycosylase [Williamsia sp. 1138]
MTGVGPGDVSPGPTPVSRLWTPPWPLDIRATMGLHRRGSGDPAMKYAPNGSIWRAIHTPDGPGTLAVSRSGDAVLGRAWGPGRQWLLDQLPLMLGSEDNPEDFVAHDEVVGKLAHLGQGLRIGRTDRVWEALAAAVLEQKVTGREAWRAWRYIVNKYGEPAPGSPSMKVPPPREVWREIPQWEWHASGAEPPRRRTIVHAAGYDVERKVDRLELLRGIGPWTVAEVRCRAVGDADAVPVGDFHIPSMVGRALIGQRIDDDQMLELLEPYAGHRFRVIRLIMLYMKMPARRAPKMPTRDYRNI